MNSLMNDLFVSRDRKQRRRETVTSILDRKPICIIRKMQSNRVITGFPPPSDPTPSHSRAEENDVFRCRAHSNFSNARR